MKTEEDALNYIVKALREQKPGTYKWGGYEVHIPSIIESYITSYEKLYHTLVRNRVIELSPLFYNAAWNLCRRGILRPGVTKHGQQATPEKNAGDGYTITALGHTWLDEIDYDDFIETESSRFTDIIQPFRQRFGDGFYQRAQEALKCYNAHAFLACCVMCGAAAESIMLALAIAKDGDEERILNMYAGAKGRKALENTIMLDKHGQQKKTWLMNTIPMFMGLLQYWRDESAHGKKSDISDTEAYTSLLLLLRFAQFAHENWDEILK